MDPNIPQQKLLTLEENGSPIYPQSNGKVKQSEACSSNNQVHPEEREGSSQGTTGRQIHSTGMWLLSIWADHVKEDQNFHPSFPYTVNTEVARQGRLQMTKAEARQKEKANFDQRHRAIPLSPLDTDIPVYMKEMDVTGTASGKAKTPVDLI